MIPRILHYVWVGGRPLPEKSRINLETWRRFCPDYEIRAWTDDNVDFGHPYLARCRELGHWANASNLLRLEKLLEHGGVYMDVDIMLRRKLDPMLVNRCFLGFQVEDDAKDWVNNAVMGAEPGHWFVERCRDRLLAEFDGTEPANHSSPRLASRLLRELGLERYWPGGLMLKDVRVYPRPVFYPHSWKETFSLQAIRPETVAVHFWEKSWHSPPEATGAPDEPLRGRLTELELAHHRLIRDAVLATAPALEPAPVAEEDGWRQWFQRLAFPRRAAVWALALTLLAASAVPAAGACDIAFDEPAIGAGEAQAGDAVIAPLGCASDPSSARHCIAPDLRSGDQATEVQIDAPAKAARAYSLWLRVGTSARSGKLRLALNGAPAIEWYVPPTQPGGWQLVTRGDGKTQAAFEIRPGANTLRIEPGPGGKAAAYADCAVLAADPAFVPGVRARHALDQAWSGVGVLFDALADDRNLFVGYYNAERLLSVAAFDRTARSWSRKVLPNRFEGWDNHNAIALALDAKGQVHVAGNMHATPLVYARTAEPRRIDSLQLVNRMVGRDEAKTTYPTWVVLPDGGLAFLYRTGSSGAGQHVINTLADGEWRRRGEAPLFGQAEAGSSAYPTDPVRGPDGMMHMAWVWRRTADAHTNYQVAYASSPDLVRWQDAAGRPIVLPLRPGASGAIDSVPERGGLANQVTLGFDAKGRPVVSYLKYDAGGATQLFQARPDAAGAWQIVQASDWQDRWELEGRGTVQALIRLESAVAPDGTGALVQGVRHWKAGRFEYVLDDATLRPTAMRPPRRLLPWALTQPQTKEAGFFALAIPARKAGGGNAAPEFVVRWEAQQSDRDRKPACTAERPRACDPPPMPLVVLEMR